MVRFWKVENVKNVVWILYLIIVYYAITVNNQTTNIPSITTIVTADNTFTVPTNTTSTRSTTLVVSTSMEASFEANTIATDTTTILSITEVKTTSIETTSQPITIVTDTSSVQCTSGFITAAPPTMPEILIILYNASACNDSSLVPLFNNTCVRTDIAYSDAVDKISNYTENDTTNLAYLLTIYYAKIASDSPSLTSAKRLSLTLIDDSVGKLKNAVIVNASTSFIMSTPPNRTNDTVIGALFKSGSGGKHILRSNSSNIIDTNFTAAAVFNESFLTSVTYLNLFILGEDSKTGLFNDSSNRTLVSPVIMANPYKNNNYPPSFTLYFANPNRTGGSFLCAYYATNTSSWEGEGCSTPTLNRTLNAYECNCNHLTSFGLIWLPPGSSDPNLRPVDIVSLVAQIVSIICFLALIIHSIVTHVTTPHVKLQSNYLLPLISCASTVFLFIFFIALVLTVYTKAKSLKTDTCFTSATILMFFVYFLLFFMFCTKTSISYFNYIHFVRLFPPPPFKQLNILLIISFIISVIAVAFGIGFNSKSSSGIIIIYGQKICWFNKDVIHYFMTIPIGIFLLINVVIFILIAKRIINHARNATSPHQSYQRMKQCALLLIVSSISQGIGWLSGPFLPVIIIGDIFEWIFVICNGLEGLWLILLYIIIRKRHMDEEKRVMAARELKKIKKDKQMKNDYNQTKDNLKQRNRQIIFRSLKRDSQWLNDYSYKVRFDLSTSEYDA